MSDVLLEAARRVLAGVCGRDEASIEASDRLADLGLDSLDRVLLAVLVEQESGRAMSDEDLAGAVTVADVARHLLTTRERV